MEIIILDKPLIKYYKQFDRFENIKKVLFLCAETRSPHLIQILVDDGIPYQFLDIPVSEWNLWKIKSQYKGDL